jgi:phage terminase small subunit
MAGRPCKVCKLKKTHPEAYRLISTEIKKEKGKAKIKQLLTTLKERFGLKVNGVNIFRHKEHLAKNSGKVVKPKKKKATEMEVYAENGELLYTNIQEIIDDLDDKEKLFCEAYVNTHNHNGTSAYLEIYQTPTYGSAATKASLLLKKVNIQLYISHLMNELSKGLRVSSSFVITSLMTNLSRCMQAEPVMGRDGEPIGIYNYNANAANKAIELIGKHIGMFEKGDNQGNQKQIYDNLIQKMANNEVSPVMALFELAKEKLPFQDMAKILLNKADLTQITEGPKREGDDLKKASNDELENRLRIISDKKEKLKCS